MAPRDAAMQRAPVVTPVVSGSVDVLKQAPATNEVQTWYYAFAAFKTFCQLLITALSAMFLYQSSFFIPGRYSSGVWTAAACGYLQLFQAVFEMADLSAELIDLKQKKGSKGADHMPWDSIIHHFVSGGYAFYVFAFYDVLDQDFLGLAIAGMACQLIGPLYTMHRLKIRPTWLPAATLGVQLLWRCPLALVSVIRAFQFFHVSPWVHSVLCLTLARLDYRWTQWSMKNFKRSKFYVKQA